MQPESAQAFPRRTRRRCSRRPGSANRSATWCARRDWRALIQYGVIFFLLEKLGAVVGTTNLHIYAAMRGQSLEDFQKTRNAQVLYSVAAQK